MQFNYIYYIAISIFLFTISCVAVKQFIPIAYKFKILDIPNERSSHTQQIVRGGGVVIVLIAGMLMLCFYWLNYLSLKIILALSCSFIVAAVGFIDDIFRLSIKLRLVVQCIASLIAVYLIMPFNFSAMIATLWLIWSTNLFNFMDGTDGLAAFEGGFVCCLSGLLLLLTSNHLGSYVLFIGAIIFGFLSCNWPPAKVFMGDAGSYFIGFFIGISSIISHLTTNVSLYFWFIIYAVFCFDATVTLLRRLFTGQAWYASHREHAYQRLQNFGWQHEQILIWLMGINIFLASLAVIAYYYDFLDIASLLVLIILSGIYLWIEFNEKIKYENSV